jgi:hypothetical protein
MPWWLKMAVGAAAGAALGFLAATFWLACAYGIEGAKEGSELHQFGRLVQQIGAGAGLLLGAVAGATYALTGARRPSA